MDFKRQPSMIIGIQNGSKSLSDPWINVTRFELLHTNSPEGHVWGQGRLTKTQVCTRPGHICREEWSNTAKSSQRKAMHKWAGEKPKLDAAREQRSICSFSDDDPEQYQNQNWRSRRAQRCLAKSPHQPTRTVQAGSDPVQVIGLKFT